MDIIIDTKRQLHPMEDLEDGNFRRTEKWSEPAHNTLDKIILTRNKKKGSCHFLLASYL